jgi:hypothetical protein
MVSLLDMYESEILVDFFLWFLESLALKVLTRQSFWEILSLRYYLVVAFYFFFKL